MAVEADLSMESGTSSEGEQDRPHPSRTEGETADQEIRIKGQSNAICCPPMWYTTIILINIDGGCSSSVLLFIKIL